MVKRLTVLIFVLCVFGVFSAAALAEAEAPGWEVTAHTFPTYLPPGVSGKIDIRVVNIGAARSNGILTSQTIFRQVWLCQRGGLCRLQAYSGNARATWPAGAYLGRPS